MPTNLSRCMEQQRLRAVGATLTSASILLRSRLMIIANMDSTSASLQAGSAWE